MLPVPMVKVKVTIPDALVLSFAVTVTLEVVVAVGVPEISPEELMLSPAGRPVAVKVSAKPPESVAWICVLTGVPTVPFCAPGLVTVTVLPVLGLTTQVKVADPCAPVPSVAVTVTLEVPWVVGVPVICPEELMLSPAGRPVAEKVSVCPDAESVAWTCTGVIAVPTLLVWLAGWVTVTVFPVLPPAGVQVTEDAGEWVPL
jgi:hypothetical protein